MVACKHWVALAGVWGGIGWRFPAILEQLTKIITLSKKKS